MSEFFLQQDRANSIAAALNWDLQRPKQFLVVRKQFDPDHVDQMEREYKRYLALTAAHPEERFPISNAVDELWHAHLLFSNDYAEMSTAVKGAFIHHRPTLTDEERDALEPFYHSGTMRPYRELFGEPPTAFWPTDSASICWSCS